MHVACLVSVRPAWTPHASVFLPPHPQLCFTSFINVPNCDPEWWSLGTGTFMGQMGVLMTLIPWVHY